jgi:hypothetical protein
MNDMKKGILFVILWVTWMLVTTYVVEKTINYPINIVLQTLIVLGVLLYTSVLLRLTFNFIKILFKND